MLALARSTPRSLSFSFVNLGYPGTILYATYASKAKPTKKPAPKPSTNPNRQTNKVAAQTKGSAKSISKPKVLAKKQELKSSTTPTEPPPSHNHPPVAFRRKRKKRVTTATMARAAKAYNRHQRRLAGDKSVGPSTPEEEVLVELYEQTEGHTIHVTKEEFDAAPENLSFEQLYRRILRTFEDHKLPQRTLLFEMLNKAKSTEDWDNFVIIAKVYQAKLIVLRPFHASYIVHLAVKRGFLNQLYDEMQKNIFYIYPSKAGYHKLIIELAKAEQLSKVWKTLQLMADRDIQPSRQTFSDLIRQYYEKDIDTALNFFRASHGLGVRTTTLDAFILAKKLASLERWSDILELEKISKKDNPNKVFRKLAALIFINAHIQTDDMAGAAQLVKAHVNAITEDITQLEEADKQAYPFITPLVESSIPQLASSSSSSP